MKHLLSFFLFLAPAAASAQGFSGHWTASSGKVSSNVGLNANCTKVEIDLDQKPDSLTVTRYHSDCGLYGSTWGPDVMTLREGKVFEGEDEVGTLTANTLMTISHDGGTDYAFNLKLVKNADGTETLETYYGVRNGTGAIATESDLRH